MVTLKCKLSEDSLKKSTLSDAVQSICSHLAGEKAYQDNSILVSNPDDDGYFYICLGGDVNKENLMLDTIL